MLLSAALELFQRAALAACAGTNALPAGNMIVGGIGFGGSEMRGAITLLGTEATWRTLAPLTMGVDLEGGLMLCDMVGELTNMLAGSLRNACLRSGVEILVATPITTRGTDLAVFPIDGSAVRWHAFATDTARVWLRLDVSFAEGFDFSGHEAAIVVPDERALVFF